MIMQKIFTQIFCLKILRSHRKMSRIKFTTFIEWSFEYGALFREKYWRTVFSYFNCPLKIFMRHHSIPDEHLYQLSVFFSFLQMLIWNLNILNYEGFYFIFWKDKLLVHSLCLKNIIMSKMYTYNSKMVSPS